MKRVSTRLLVLSLILAFALQSTNALSQSSPEATIIDDLLQCMSIEDDQGRLQCYDERLQQVADLTPNGASEADRKFTGRGDWQSEPFVMEQDWRLAWQSETDLLTIQLIGPTPLQQQTVVDNQIGNSAGRTSPQEPGEYRIDVRALGDWQILVLEE